MWGLDSSGQMIKMAIKYAEKHNIGPNLLMADAIHLPFNDGTFDYELAVAT